MKNKFYITTAIDYVNARPHIGHAYEKILADVLARWHRLVKDDVHFLTGTDENAQKNVQAAKQAKLPVKQFIDKNAQHFIDLCKTLDISYDEFIRTTEPRHIKKSQEIIQQVYEKGDIYKGTYEGLYCEGCEEFKTERDLINGKCPDHNIEPKQISEDAYFFKLSKYQKQILKALKEGLIKPQKRANEIIARLEEDDLKDLCVSRSDVDWGIEVPFDKKFKIYVWFDALINYITGSGKKEEYWPAQVHVIGKGINWFHSVIWPAMLLSAGYKLPKNVLVHGYLTVDGQKMSKSLGNVIDPLEIAQKYGTDSVRYFLLREVSIENDGDFSESTLKERHNNELANKLGNLVSRLSTLAEKYGIEKSETENITERIERIKEHFENYELDRALHELFAYVDSINEYLQINKPWETKDTKVLYNAANSLKNATILLYPFLPQTCEKIATTFNFKIDWKSLEQDLKISKIRKSDILFKKIE
jgi:methionyl-tRNA synthetase